MFNIINIPDTTEITSTDPAARTMEVAYSRSGLPCLWEKGGGCTNVGEAQIIADAYGNPKRAIYVRNRGDLACKEHALVPVTTGDHVITVARHHNRVKITVEQIATIRGNTATLISSNEQVNVAAIFAAFEKSMDYHCRRPYYIKEEDYHDKK